MPFTPAHAAAVLPFLKIPARYLSGTALVLGSFAPDFQYFLTMSVSGDFSHSLKGLFLFDVPVVLMLSLIFHLVVKQSLMRNLPAFLQMRFRSLTDFDFMKFLKSHPVSFFAGAIIGSASHIFWDSFTHADGFFVRHLSIYKGAYVPHDGVRYPMWYALQHLSTIVGLAIIFLYIILKRPDSTHPVTDKPGGGYWISLVGVTAVAVAVRFLIKSSDYNLGTFVVTSISGFCIALVVCGLVENGRRESNSI